MTEPKPARPWDILNPNTDYVSAEISDSRMALCNLCPELIPTGSVCKKCGCFMVIKTKMSHAFCPLEKW